MTALSLACSIEWSDNEVELVRGTDVVRSEGVVYLSDVGIYSQYS